SDCGGRGICVSSGFHNVELKSNSITNVGSEGIFLQMAKNSEISFNTISKAEDVGIGIIGFDTCILKNNTIDSIIGKGVSVDYCELSTIIMNDIKNCTEIGIESLGGSNTTILENTIYDCDGYAVSLNEDTEFFDIKFNVFLSNGGSCQLNDDGENNIFIYNYFSDWLSPDDNSDNFVDLPYEIDGVAENSDDWPVTTAGYNPSPTTTTGTSSTTTGSGSTPDLIMTLIIAGSAIGIIVIVAGILVLKKR
ncbi:MAG: right-handed parallel beta-helix repeat-containing protein, partial [Candidatus Thorarchaeota archaeon]